ncbi:beta strand repeat-containing protein [Sphingobium sp. B2]|uniref:beta strand repeat-containing protein n=1 Tax=Sphingobium sp. B2 TaxID=2583228 RepID=UPI00119F1D74|nr:hypothetical protein [Sphingobium sp. B2]
MPNAFSSRPRLLLGSAIAVLATSASLPALASSPGVSATGARVVASDQSQIGAPVTASASDPVITTTTVPTDARIEVSLNAIAATARGNQGDNSQSPDALDLASAEGGTWLSTGSLGVEAWAPALVASLQRTQTAPVTADVTASRIAADNGPVTGSSVTVGDNRQEAVALANDVTNALSLTGIVGSNGAGIASRQSLGTASRVAASMTGKTELIAQKDDASALGLDNNLQRSIAYGNTADNALNADVVTIVAPESWGLASLVPYQGSSEVAAAYGVLSDQSAQSMVNAVTKGGYRLLVRQLATGSEMSADGNAILAAGYGSQSANSASLDAVNIGADYGVGAIANVTNVQRAKSGVTAETGGSTKVWLVSDPVDSRVTADGNSIQAIATANLATGNRLDVRATSIGAGESGPEGGVEGGDYIGTARLDYGRTLTVSAPFSVQNAQTYLAPVSAIVRNSMTRITDGDIFVASSGSASDNSVAASATGNSGASSLTLDAVSLSTAADLNSGQFGEGDISAMVGSASDRTGASVVGLSEVNGSSLTVGRNSVQGSATANIADNSMEISATQLANVSGHDDAQAGVDGGDASAAADYALANHQLLGTARTVSIASDVVGHFAATGASVAESSLSIADNSQLSIARGNDAANRLDLNATNLRGDQLAPGTALSSYQVAAANVAATSDLLLELTGTAQHSALALSNNRNTAFAQINGVDNAMTIDAVHIGALSGDNAAADIWAGAPGTVAGDHVLANNQSASGEATATALTAASNPVSRRALLESTWSATGNTTVAQAGANQASNTVAVTSVADREASAGVLNSQQSNAGVHAVARADLGHSASALTSSQATIDGNATAAVARGNSADNRLTLTGGAGGSLPAEASAFLGSHAQASASAMVLNAQTNSGAVAARAENVLHQTALNGGVYQSGIALNGNSVSAAASGNSATNAVALASLDRLPTASLANVQINSGPVSAQVIGATFRSVSGGLTSSSLTASGNIVSASAAGNIATNAITSAR